MLWGPGALDVPEHRSMTVRSWETGEGITVLGVPIDCPGHTSQAAAAWDTAGERLSRLLEVLTRLPDA